MTNEEAIEILSSVGDINRCCSDDAEALDMAIKALGAQEIRCDSNMEEVAKSFIEDVETVKDQLDGQPCEDCIRRSDVLALAEKGALVSNGNYQAVCKAINELPSVKPKGESESDD